MTAWKRFTVLVLTIAVLAPNTQHAHASPAKPGPKLKVLIGRCIDRSDDGTPLVASFLREAVQNEMRRGRASRFTCTPDEETLACARQLVPSQSDTIGLESLSETDWNRVASKMNLDAIVTSDVIRLYSSGRYRTVVTVHIYSLLIMDNVLIGSASEQIRDPKDAIARATVSAISQCTRAPMVITRILNVVSRNGGDEVVVIDRGRRHGVRPSMRFAVVHGTHEASERIATLIAALVFDQDAEADVSVKSKSIRIGDIAVSLAQPPGTADAALGDGPHPRTSK